MNLSDEAVGQQERAFAIAAAGGLSGIERAAHLPGFLWTVEREPKNAGHSSHSTVHNGDDQLGGVEALALPYPAWTNPVSEIRLHAFEAARVLFVVSLQVVGFGPQRPIIRTQIKRVEHASLHLVHARRILCQFVYVVLAKVADRKSVV